MACGSYDCFDLAMLWPLLLFLGLACCGIFQCWCAQKASVCVNGGEDTAAEPSLPSRSIPLGDGGEESDVAPISTTTTTTIQPSSGVPDESIIASIFATLSIEERTAWYHEAFQRNQHEAILPHKRPKVTAEKDGATRPPAVRKSKAERNSNSKRNSQARQGESQRPSDGSSVDAARTPRDNNQRSIQPKKDRSKGSRQSAPKPSAATATPNSTASDRPKRASRGDATTSKGVAGPAATRAAPAAHREACVVCLEDFRPGETIVWSETPSCPHVFHKDCLVRVFAHTPRKPTQEFVANPCPICRRPFVTVGASNLENTCHGC